MKFVQIFHLVSYDICFVWTTLMLRDASYWSRDIKQPIKEGEIITTFYEWTNETDCIEKLLGYTIICLIFPVS